ncbi:unnamed protein product [Protopolystoma xenopodis]|uniref:Uncharacterized protein n=1 Tax=Protopolystoma xenopodis TaxID=117903 RepID=A0A448WKX1_9PLAT|nr:unnamed protein product [Protopolystoma xenopodis]
MRSISALARELFEKRPLEGYLSPCLFLKEPSELAVSIESENHSLLSSRLGHVKCHADLVYLLSASLHSTRMHMLPGGLFHSSPNVSSLEAVEGASTVKPAPMAKPTCARSNCLGEMAASTTGMAIAATTWKSSHPPPPSLLGPELLQHLRGRQKDRLQRICKGRANRLKLRLHRGLAAVRPPPASFGSAGQSFSPACPSRPPQARLGLRHLRQLRSSPEPADTIGLTDHSPPPPPPPPSPPPTSSDLLPCDENGGTVTRSASSQRLAVLFESSSPSTPPTRREYSQLDESADLPIRLQLGPKGPHIRLASLPDELAAKLTIRDGLITSPVDRQTEKVLRALAQLHQCPWLLRLPPALLAELPPLCAIPPPPPSSSPPDDDDDADEDYADNVDAASNEVDDVYNGANDAAEGDGYNGYDLSNGEDKEKANGTAACLAVGRRDGWSGRLGVTAEVGNRRRRRRISGLARLTRGDIWGADRQSKAPNHDDPEADSNGNGDDDDDDEVDSDDGEEKNQVRRGQMNNEGASYSSVSLDESNSTSFLVSDASSTTISGPSEATSTTVAVASFRRPDGIQARQLGPPSSTGQPELAKAGPEAGAPHHLPRCIMTPRNSRRSGLTATPSALIPPSIIEDRRQLAQEQSEPAAKTTDWGAAEFGQLCPRRPSSSRTSQKRRKPEAYKSFAAQTSRGQNRSSNLPLVKPRHANRQSSESGRIEALRQFGCHFKNIIDRKEFKESLRFADFFKPRLSYADF